MSRPPISTLDLNKPEQQSNLLAAMMNLEALAERWESTPVWHDPIFRDGRIHINTGDLHDIAVLLRWAQRVIGAVAESPKANEGSD